MGVDVGGFAGAALATGIAFALDADDDMATVGASRSGFRGRSMICDREPDNN